MTGTAAEERAARTEQPRWFARPLTWIGSAIGAGVITVVGVVVTKGWLHVEDGWRDRGGAAPIRAATYYRNWEGDTGAFAHALLHGPDRFLLLRGADSDEWNALLRRHRAAQVGHQEITVVIQGLRNKGVRIIDVRPRILAAGPVLSGTCISVPTGGDAGTFKVKADLDHLRPGKGRAGTFLDKSVELLENDRMTVHLSVRAKKRAYEYDIEIIYDYGDGSTLRQSHVKQADGQPFRVTGAAKRYKVSYTDPGLTGTYRARRNGSCR